MLGPILSAVAQSVGSFAVQTLQLMGPSIASRAGHILSARYEQWYYSLDDETRSRLDNATIWVVKELVANGVASITGLPVQTVVKKVLDEAEVSWTSEAAEYVESRLKQDISG